MNIYLTVDVECYHGDYAREVYGHGYGLPLILRELQANKAVATFFVEALGATRWGLDATKRICDEIMEAGSEVQLHIHPAVADIDGFRDDTDVLHMQPLDKQVMLIEKGLAILEECGISGISCFRAGDFAADENTVTAMKTCGLIVSSNRDLDSKCSTRSKLNDLCSVKNDISELNGVIDVPLTCARSSIPFWDGRYRHLEISAMSRQEIEWAVNAIEVQNYQAVTLLTHPGELFNRTTGRPSGKNISRLEWFCDNFATRMSTMSGVECGEASGEKKVIPRLPFFRSAGRLLEQGASRLANG